MGFALLSSAVPGCCMFPLTMAYTVSSLDSSPAALVSKKVPHSLELWHCRSGHLNEPSIPELASRYDVWLRMGSGADVCLLASRERRRSSGGR